MDPKLEHFMEEADIGSGEKTPAELADLKETERLREQQEQARQQGHPLDGGLLLQVTEEQQYIAQHESHTPPDKADAVATAGAPSTASPPQVTRSRKKARRGRARHDAAGHTSTG